MRIGVVRSLVAVSSVALLAALGACASSGSSSQDSGGGGSLLSNLFFYGGTTVPPAAVQPSIEVADCPPVDIGNDGAAIKSGANQISISNVARECSGQRDGSILVKVGVEGRALLGPGGSAGRFEAPVYVVLKRGDRILASRARRVAISIPAGDTYGSFVTVEEGLVVPPGIGGEFEIAVGLGSGPGRATSAPSRKRRARG